MQKNKRAYILEIIWLIVTIVATGIAIHATITRGFDIGMYLLVLLSLGIYLLRRNSRKK